MLNKCILLLLCSGCVCYSVCVTVSVFVGVTVTLCVCLSMCVCVLISVHKQINGAMVRYVSAISILGVSHVMSTDWSVD